MRLLYIALFSLVLFTACVDSSEDVYGERLEIRVENIDQEIHVNIGSPLNISPKILHYFGFAPNFIGFASDIIEMLANF